MYVFLGSILGEEHVECIHGSTGPVAQAISQSCEDLSNIFSWPSQIDLTIFLYSVSPSQMMHPYLGFSMVHNVVPHNVILNPSL